MSSGRTPLLNSDIQTGGDESPINMGHHVLVPYSQGSKRGQGDLHKPEWAAGDWFEGLSKEEQRGPMGWPWVFALDALSKDKESDCSQQQEWRRTPCDFSPFSEASFFIPNSAAFEVAGGQVSASCHFWIHAWSQVPLEAPATGRSPVLWDTRGIWKEQFIQKALILAPSLFVWTRSLMSTHNKLIHTPLPGYVWYAREAPALYRKPLLYKFPFSWKQKQNNY